MRNCWEKKEKSNQETRHGRLSHRENKTKQLATQDPQGRFQCRKVRERPRVHHTLGSVARQKQEEDPGNHQEFI